MRGWRDPILGLGLVIQLTITVVVAALIPVLLGIWIDGLLRTSPFVTLFLMVVGISLGAVAVYRGIAKEYQRVGGNNS